MSQVKVLLIDDEPSIRKLVSAYLAPEGYQVYNATDGLEGLKAFRAYHPDLVVLDLMLPGMDGLEVLAQIRRESEVYVILLIARTEETDKIVGLSVGADDYVTKPFSPRELVARIRAMLRRPRQAADVGEPVRRFGDLTVDPAAREVLLDGRPVELTRLEFDLLDALSGSPRLVLTRAQLLERVWGPSWFGDDHVVDVHIANLRQKLGDDPRSPRYIRTVRGVGYRMGAGT